MATQLYNVCLSSFSSGEKPKILNYARFFFKTILDEDIVTKIVLLIYV